MGPGDSPWIEVDLGAIEHNVGVLRRRAGVPLLAVVKCDAYGHGLVPASAAALRGGAVGLGVGGLNEARLARRGFAKARIVDLFPSNAMNRVAAAEFVALGIEKAVASLGEVERLADAARRARTIAAVQLKVDTGLRRLGADLRTAERLLLKIATLPMLRLAGVFTTLAERGEKSTAAQIQVLRRVGASAKALGLEPELHASSTASMGSAAARLRMVRIGLAIYGVGAERPIGGLVPALSLRAPVLSVRAVEALEHVGYGKLYPTARRTLVVTLGAGSADGVPRSLSNEGAVIIGGAVRPMIGRVSLNHCLVDPGSRQRSEKSHATLIGTEGKARILVEDVARAAGTSPYEILVRLSPRLERRYFKGGRLVQVRTVRDEYRAVR